MFTLPLPEPHEVLRKLARESTAEAIRQISSLDFALESLGLRGPRSDSSTSPTAPTPRKRGPKPGPRPDKAHVSEAKYRAMHREVHSTYPTKRGRAKALARKLGVSVRTIWNYHDKYDWPL